MGLLAVFCVTMLLAIPVGYGLIIAAGAAILWNGLLPMSIVAQQVFDQTQSFPMLALPFFMLAGTLMLGGKLGSQLLELATHVMQRWRGGALSTTVVSSVVFGGPHRALEAGRRDRPRHGEGRPRRPRSGGW